MPDLMCGGGLYPSLLPDGQVVWIVEDALGQGVGLPVEDPPLPGDVVTVWRDTQGFVRGLALNGAVLFYRTLDQQARALGHTRLV